MESASPLLFTTPKKTQLHSLSSSSAAPAVATPEPRQCRVVKPSSDSGSDLPELACGVAPNHPSLLPQKYELLYEFFNAMVNSIRLHRLKRLPSTLTRLSCGIESLTKRRFTLHHLAQLKHIVPEVIEVKKIRVQDDKTKCMKEELLVSLNVDAVATDVNTKDGCRFSRLKELFKSRLADYSLAHDEGDDVVEGDIPQLFYQPKQEPEPSTCVASAPIVLSHTAPSFKRRFSSRALDAPVLAEESSGLIETATKVTSATEAKDGSSISTVKTNVLISTPAKLVLTPDKLVSTPTKLTSTPERLMAATPALLPSKRALMTPHHNCSSDYPDRPAKRRALNFEHSRNDMVDDSSQVCEEAIGCQAQGSNDLVESQLVETEHKSIEEQDSIFSQEKSKQQLMAGVPKLFDMILQLFQSLRRSAVTKEELIYKLVTGHLDFVDRREVEKQLELLQELAPECISELQSLSGDTLLHLNKASCPASIHTKLVEAE